MKDYFDKGDIVTFGELPIGAIFRLDKKSTVQYTKTILFKVEFGVHKNAYNTDTAKFTFFENNKKVIYDGMVRKEKKYDVIVTK